MTTLEPVLSAAAEPLQDEAMKRRPLSPEARARLERDVRAATAAPKRPRGAPAPVLALDLKALRQLVGKTQLALASATRMDQSELSKAERRKDHLLSTLRRYVAALGGELEVLARFGEHTIHLKDV